MLQKKLLLIFVLMAFLYILSPLLIPVILGGVFSVLLIPFVEKLEAKRIPDWIAAGIVTFVVTLGLILPGGFLGITGARLAFFEFKALQLTSAEVTEKKNSRTSQEVQEASSGEGISKFIEDRFGELKLNERIQRVSRYLPIKTEELVDQAKEVGKGLISKVASGLGIVVGRLPAIALDLAILVLSMFFFLLDGRAFVLFLKRHSFLPTDTTDSIFLTFGQMCKSVILASLASGLSQAFIFALVMWILDLNHVFLWGVSVFLGSFIPLVGAAPITLGLSVYYILIGSGPIGWAVLVTALVVFSVDNVIRALVLRGAANLHPLLAFLSALGGLKTLGFSGVFLGPILAGLSVVMIQEIKPKR